MLSDHQLLPAPPSPASDDTLLRLLVTQEQELAPHILALNDVSGMLQAQALKQAIQTIVNDLIKQQVTTIPLVTTAALEELVIANTVSPADVYKLMLAKLAESLHIAPTQIPLSVQAKILHTLKNYCISYQTIAKQFVAGMAQGTSATRFSALEDWLLGKIALLIVQLYAQFRIFLQTILPQVPASTLATPTCIAGLAKLQLTLPEPKWQWFKPQAPKLHIKLLTTKIAWATANLVRLQLISNTIGQEITSRLATTTTILNISPETLNSYKVFFQNDACDNITIKEAFAVHSNYTWHFLKLLELPNTPVNRKLLGQTLDLITAEPLVINRELLKKIIVGASLTTEELTTLDCQVPINISNQTELLAQKTRYHKIHTQILELLQHPKLTQLPLLRTLQTELSSSNYYELYQKTQVLARYHQICGTMDLLAVCVAKFTCQHLATLRDSTSDIAAQDTARCLTYSTLINKYFGATTKTQLTLLAKNNLAILTRFITEPFTAQALKRTIVNSWFRPIFLLSILEPELHAAMSQKLQTVCANYVGILPTITVTRTDLATYAELLTASPYDGSNSHLLTILDVIDTQGNYKAMYLTKRLWFLFAQQPPQFKLTTLEHTFIINNRYPLLQHSLANIIKYYWYKNGWSPALQEFARTYSDKATANMLIIPVLEANRKLFISKVAEQLTQAAHNPTAAQVTFAELPGFNDFKRYLKLLVNPELEDLISYHLTNDAIPTTLLQQVINHLPPSSHKLFLQDQFTLKVIAYLLQNPTGIDAFLAKIIVISQKQQHALDTILLNSDPTQAIRFVDFASPPAQKALYWQLTNYYCKHPQVISLATELRNLPQLIEPTKLPDWYQLIVTTLGNLAPHTQITKQAFLKLLDHSDWAAIPEATCQLIQKKYLQIFLTLCQITNPRELITLAKHLLELLHQATVTQNFTQLRWQHRLLKNFFATVNKQLMTTCLDQQTNAGIQNFISALNKLLVKHSETTRALLQTFLTTCHNNLTLNTYVQQLILPFVASAPHKLTPIALATFEQLNGVTYLTQMLDTPQKIPQAALTLLRAILYSPNTACIIEQYNTFVSNYNAVLKLLTNPALMIPPCTASNPYYQLKIWTTLLDRLLPTTNITALAWIALHGSLQQKLYLVRQPKIMRLLATKALTLKTLEEPEPQLLLPMIVSYHLKPLYKQFLKELENTLESKLRTATFWQKIWLRIQAWFRKLLRVKLPSGKIHHACIQNYTGSTFDTHLATLLILGTAEQQCYVIYQRLHYLFVTATYLNPPLTLEEQFITTYLTKAVLAQQQAQGLFTKLIDKILSAWNQGGSCNYNSAIATIIATFGTTSQQQLYFTNITELQTLDSTLDEAAPDPTILQQLEILWGCDSTTWLPPLKQRLHTIIAKHLSHKKPTPLLANLIRRFVPHPHQGAYLGHLIYNLVKHSLQTNTYDTTWDTILDSATNPYINTAQQTAIDALLLQEGHQQDVNQKLLMSLATHFSTLPIRQRLRLIWLYQYLTPTPTSHLPTLQLQHFTQLLTMHVKHNFLRYIGLANITELCSVIDQTLTHIAHHPEAYVLQTVTIVTILLSPEAARQLTQVAPRYLDDFHKLKLQLQTIQWVHTLVTLTTSDKSGILPASQLFPAEIPTIIQLLTQAQKYLSIKCVIQYTTTNKICALTQHALNALVQSLQENRPSSENTTLQTYQDALMCYHTIQSWITTGSGMPLTQEHALRVQQSPYGNLTYWHTVASSALAQLPLCNWYSRLFNVIGLATLELSPKETTLITFILILGSPEQRAAIPIKAQQYLKPPSPGISCV